MHFSICGTVEELILHVITIGKDVGVYLCILQTLNY